MEGHYDSATLIDYLHGELDPATDAAIFAHLETCAACSAECRAEIELGEAIRAAAGREELKMPGDLPASIRLAAFALPASSRIAAWLRARRVVWALPAAALLAFVLWIGGSDLRSARRQTASINARYYLEVHDAQARSIPDGERTGPVAFVRANQAYIGEMAPGITAAGSGS